MEKNKTSLMRNIISTIRKSFLKWTRKLAFCFQEKEQDLEVDYRLLMASPLPEVSVGQIRRLVNKDTEIKIIADYEPLISGKNRFLNNQYNEYKIDEMLFNHVGDEKAIFIYIVEEPKHKEQ